VASCHNTSSLGISQANATGGEHNNNNNKNDTSTIPQRYLNDTSTNRNDHAHIRRVGCALQFSPQYFPAKWGPRLLGPHHLRKKTNYAMNFELLGTNFTAWAGTGSIPSNYKIIMKLLQKIFTILCHRSSRPLNQPVYAVWSPHIGMRRARTKDGTSSSEACDAPGHNVARRL
jgi:hypothetical protein